MICIFLFRYRTRDAIFDEIDPFIINLEGDDSEDLDEEDELSDAELDRLEEADQEADQDAAQELDQEAAQDADQEMDLEADQELDENQGPMDEDCDEMPMEDWNQDLITIVNPSHCSSTAICASENASVCMSMSAGMNASVGGSVCAGMDGSVVASWSAGVCASVDVDMIECANEARMNLSMREPVWKCPVCQGWWQEDGQAWLGCDSCHRNWHAGCMPLKMKEEAPTVLSK